jgi:hypothetical protein
MHSTQDIFAHSLSMKYLYSYVQRCVSSNPQAGGQPLYKWAGAFERPEFLARHAEEFLMAGLEDLFDTADADRRDGAVEIGGVQPPPKRRTSARASPVDNGPANPSSPSVSISSGNENTPPFQSHGTLESDSTCRMADPQLLAHVTDYELAHLEAGNAAVHAPFQGDILEDSWGTSKARTGGKEEGKRKRCTLRPYVLVH